MKRNAWFVLIAVAMLLTAARLSYADSPTITHDVGFKVGLNSQINWFEIDNPSVDGTIVVANQPYLSSHDLNASVVDGSNRLIYIDDTDPASPAFAINLTGLTLVPNAATSVNVTSLGDWPAGNDNAGLNRATGQVYYHVYNSDELRTLNFDSSGNISGFTTVGTLNGSSFSTPSITTGDLDIDSSGNIWIAGKNNVNEPRLWSFNSTTLTVMTNVDPSEAFAGIIFDATGTTLYGYHGSGEYGIIDPTTGNFQTVLINDPSVFNSSGDLAEGIETIAVPEPSTLVLMLAGLAAMVFYFARRRSCVCC